MRFSFFLPFLFFLLQIQAWDFIELTNGDFKYDKDLIKSQIDTLNSVIAKYFRKNPFDKRFLFIKRSYLLRKGEIQVLFQGQNIEITISPEEIFLDKNSLLKIAKILLIKYLDLSADHDKKSDEIIPDWVAFAFIYKSEKMLKRPFITLPYYPYLRALLIYPCSFNYEALLKNDKKLKEDFILNIKSEIAWSIISSIGKSSTGNNFIDELKSYSQQIVLDASLQDNKILEKKCIPDSTFTIIKYSSLNYFYPMPPKNCEEEVQTTINFLLDILKKEYDNSELEFQEKRNAINDAVTKFNNMQKYLPYFSRSSFDTFYSKLKSFQSDFKKISAFLENTTINDIFNKDKYIYELMKKSEEKFLSPGKKYTLLLEHLPRDKTALQEITK
ncbi:MAG TPA: hypothetical protein PLN24_03025 [Victivallales bacterium]|nr:hypothetical protein [Victivallales bacterium]HPO90343.1 hypothetical protein [Victivallales bacterium]HRU00858.1 hypothetical protein [Victivallales bacterium]